MAAERRAQAIMAAGALVIGGGTGLAAVGFRYLIYGVTWLATGHNQFGQQGHAASAHLSFLGPWFVLLVPIIGGLIYGPLIYRYASEARGHGVPEVMLAVAENGGRIRPQVTVIKALASALCIGTGGSVGREGPIVQIGSALGSTFGRLTRAPSGGLRILVACGAAAGISATFNAPLTGVLFAFEIILRELSVAAALPVILASVSADMVGRAFLGSKPFLSGLPPGLAIHHDSTYLLILATGIAAGLVGVGFKAFLYWMEDLGDRLWAGRPEWARPAVGGVLLGLLLLALPQMYGVGYPVMYRAVDGHYALMFVLVLLIGKVLASSLTLSIGGSGGIFAPSLFVGAMAGSLLGHGATHAFGSGVGEPAMYALIAMGGVFAGATQSPLTAIATVLEMSGDFSLALPVILAAGVAAAVSRQLSYGSIYTTKLLRRGIDIDAPEKPLPLSAAA
jgi:CIC family chloride channel protein